MVAVRYLESRQATIQEILSVLLSLQGRSADESASRYEDCDTLRAQVEVRVGVAIPARFVQLQAHIAPVAQAEIAGFALEGVLAELPVIDTLSDEVLAELELAMH